MWMNIVRLLPTHMREDTRQLHDGLPNMQQTLLHFITVVHPRLVDSLLDDAPHLVVDRVEVRTVWWP